MKSLPICLVALVALTGCDRLQNVGRAPDFNQVHTGDEYFAMTHPGLPETGEVLPVGPQASLWDRGRASLLGERRAGNRGDILTVVVEIDDRAEFSNQSNRSRSGSEAMSVPQLLGLPQRIDTRLPEGATSANAVSTTSDSQSSGDGSIRRNEKLTLRIAATVVEKMQNGVLRIQGTQEVRVNFELRELVVTGFVRPGDISRQNEITYDKIAAARISYGGRGQITDMQQPRYGQQIADIILPF